MKPQPNFTVGGSSPTGRFRIRIGWFFFPIIEELYQYLDGSFQWKRLSWMHSVEFMERKDDHA